MSCRGAGFEENDFPFVIEKIRGTQVSVGELNLDWSPRNLEGTQGRDNDGFDEQAR